MSRANQNGKLLERNVATTLTECRITFNRQVKIGTHIFGHTLKVDFVLTNLREYPNGLVLECKWQDSDGSVDEKFPTLVMNLRDHCPVPSVVVIAGGKCRPGALKWIKAQYDGQKLLRIFRYEEFMSWAARVDILEPPSLNAAATLPSARSTPLKPAS